MNTRYFLVILLFAASPATAQTPARLSIAKEAGLISFSSDFSQGELIFNKTFRKNGSGMFVPAYSMQNKSYNNGKPVEVTMSRESFDTYFNTTSALAAKRNWVIKHTQQQKLSFTNEKGWKDAIDFFNGLARQ